ncbi:MAG: hypothetical protein IJ856_05425 [Candidatus Methanomethylophilaceae archaeon]|nr:hypothetical protein [Candidatus Methanomethylophilaceae archaeon]
MAEKESGAKTALGIGLIAIAVIAILAVVVWVILQPGVLESIATIAVLAVIVLLAIGVIIFVVTTILAVPYYIIKKQDPQSGNYEIDDIQSVNGSASDDGRDKK